MDMPEQEFHRRLHKMKSLLKFTPDDIYLHHRSFLEFLHDPTRSGQYNMSTQGAVKQRVVSVISSVVRAAEQAIDQPNYHPPVPTEARARHNYEAVQPTYRDMFSGDDLREISRPLLKFQDRLLHLPNIVPRNECTVFHVVNNLLSELSHREIDEVILEFLLEGFSSLLTYFRTLKVNKGIFDLTLLSVKPEVVAMKVHTWSEAQKLMDLTYLNLYFEWELITNSGCQWKIPPNRPLQWGEDVARKAVQLAF
ncbi:hypothetical protein JOM56_004547 [Amanita muscaria]